MGGFTANENFSLVTKTEKFSWPVYIAMMCFEISSNIDERNTAENERFIKRGSG